MAKELKCTEVVERDNGHDTRGRLVIYHEKCGAPAAEVTIDGILTSAKAVLCGRHKAIAERESFSNENGYRAARKKAKEDDPRQMRL